MNVEEAYREAVVEEVARLFKRTEIDVEAALAARTAMLKAHDWKARDGIPMDWEHMIHCAFVVEQSATELAKAIKAECRGGGLFGQVKAWRA